MFTEDDNLESDIATDAWREFVQDIYANRVPNLSLAQFEHDTGIPLSKGDGLVSTLPTVRRFLNQMSGMRCTLQEAFGEAFKAKITKIKTDRIAAGNYDRGIETIAPKSLVKLDDTVILRDPRTGATTRLLTLLRRDDASPVTYSEAHHQSVMHAIKNQAPAQFAKSPLTNRVCCILFPKVLKWRPPTVDDPITVITPTGYRQSTRGKWLGERWTLASSVEINALWDAELMEGVPDDETIFHVVSGTLLPIWDRLPRDKAIVYRMQTDTGEQILDA